MSLGGIGSGLGGLCSGLGGLCSGDAGSFFNPYEEQNYLRRLTLQQMQQRGLMANPADKPEPPKHMNRKLLLLT